MYIYLSIYICIYIFVLYIYLYIYIDIFWALNIYCNNHMNPQFKGLENAWSSADRSLRVMESQRQHPLRTRSFQWKALLLCSLPLV